MQKEELRRTPITLHQNSFFSVRERQWQPDLDEQRDGWSHLERRVIAAMKDCPKKCINVKVEIAALELLREPGEAEVCLRYILKHAKRRGSGIFVIFDTQEKMDHFVASRTRWLEYQGERVALQESGQHDWQGDKYEGIVAKAPCLERSLKTPLPQQSSSSSREEEGQWISVEDRRKRRVAFEETAKRMLGYLKDSEDLRVGVADLQELLEISEEAGVSIRQIAHQVRDEKGQKISEFFLRQGEEEVCIARNTQLKGLAELERRCQGTLQEVKLLSERKRSSEGHGGRQGQFAEQSKRRSWKRSTRSSVTHMERSTC